MQRTLKYFSSLILCIFVSSAQAKKPTKAKEINNAPFFNGITVQADVASVAGSLLSKGGTYSYEGAVQADFKHKLFPTIELGYAGANKISIENNEFKGNGPFGRIGVDLNIITPKKDSKPTNNLFLVGLRLGMTNFKYNISNMSITDNYWGGSQIVPFNNLVSTKVWYEIAVGIRVEVIKDIFMGWSIRSKTLISQDVAGNATPWYIPGYGVNGASNFGINYTIGFKFNVPHTTKVAINNTVIKQTK